MAKATIAEIRKAILGELPKDGAAVGNHNLLRRIPELLGSKVKDNNYSEKFVESRGGELGGISIYGKESNATTRHFATMNLAIRGIQADIGKEHVDAVRHVQYPDMRANNLFSKN